MQVRELQIRLELLVDPALNSYRDIHGIAIALADYNLVEQKRFLEAVDRIAQHDAGLAYHFCHSASPALTVLPDHAWQPWLEQIIQTYARDGVRAAFAVIEGFRQHRGQLRGSPSAVSYVEIAGIMEAFIRGLSNRDFKLSTGKSSFTDTETLYFPERIECYHDRDANFKLYKACAAHLWAQSQFGTWEIDPQPTLMAFPDSERALRIFHRLETYRLDACLARELPGVAREMRQFRTADHTHGGQWQQAARSLAAPQTEVGDSLRWLQHLYPGADDPPPAAYQGVLQPEAVQKATNRIDDRKQEMAVPSSNSEEMPQPADADGMGDELREPGQLDTPPEHNDYTYDEWDQARQCYRERWCRLQERQLAAEPNSFRAHTLSKYRGLLSRLRRTFEALRQDPRPSRRETDGKDIDLDALVESLSDLRAGMDMSDRLFIRTRRDRTSVATLFLIDMSASTRGWVNKVERETLVLLCEALELLGDRYAIYGFSSRGHEHCISYPIKDFGEPYGETVWRRIGAIEAQQYTRMGVAIRHHSAKLLAVEARTRLLIVLSDGRPDDEGGYRGAYGIEDTRKALMETRQAGIHPFCITIDTDALDYLPHMFGRDNFVVIDKVDRLPYRIGDVYRKLTG